MKTMIVGALCLFASSSIGQTFIDFEHTPGPDGLLGTADDLATAAGQIVLNDYASVGVVFHQDNSTGFSGVPTIKDNFLSGGHWLGTSLVNLQADFLAPASFIAFDTGTNVPPFQARVSMLRLDGSVITTLDAISHFEYSAGEPVYSMVLTGGTSPNQPVLDNLTFIQIPAPSALAMAGVLGLCSGWRSRRR